MRMIFVNRFFYPDHSATSQMLSDLAFGLDAQRINVEVVTSRQRYDLPSARLPPVERIGTLVVHRVWTSRFGRANLVGRAIDYATFYLSASWRLLRLARAGDVIVAKTDPPMLSVLIAPIARLRRAKLVNWLQDIFPEVAAELGFRGAASRLTFRVLRMLRNRSLRGAAVNVVLGERMAAKLIALGVEGDRVEIIPNWADGGLIQPVDPAANQLRNAWGLLGRFVVGYSGNLGRAHEVGTLLDAIAIVEQDPSAPPVTWLFIGGGALYEELQSEIARRQLDTVQFRPYQPRERLAESLSAADVHLVSLKPELEGLIVPSKFYGVAAAGRPTIFIGDPDGEIPRLISQHNIGRTVANGDCAGLAETILSLAADQATCRLMGARAQNLRSGVL